MKNPNKNPKAAPVSLREFWERVRSSTTCPRTREYADARLAGLPPVEAMRKVYP